MNKAYTCALSYTEDKLTDWETYALLVASRQIMTSSTKCAPPGNAVSVVIVLVGVLDFINLMVTVIVSCKREFVVIQSVSMTRKQFNRMLVNECLFYAVLTLGASYLISSLTVGIMVRVMKKRICDLSVYAPDFPPLFPQPGEAWNPCEWNDINIIKSAGRRQKKKAVVQQAIIMHKFGKRRLSISRPPFLMPSTKE